MTIWCAAQRKSQLGAGKMTVNIPSSTDVSQPSRKNIWVPHQPSLRFRSHAWGLQPGGTHETHLVISQQLLSVHIKTAAGFSWVIHTVRDAVLFTGGHRGLTRTTAWNQPKKTHTHQWWTFTSRPVVAQRWDWWADGLLGSYRAGVARPTVTFYRLVTFPYGAEMLSAHRCCPSPDRRFTVPPLSGATHRAGPRSNNGGITHVFGDTLCARWLPGPRQRQRSLARSR